MLFSSAGTRGDRGGEEVGVRGSELSSHIVGGGVFAEKVLAFGGVIIGRVAKL